MSRHLSQRLIAHRARLWRRNPKCAYCLRTIEDQRHASLDHIKPRSRGGSNARCNLALVCRPCNLAKRDLTPLELVRWAIRIARIARGQVKGGAA